MLQRLVYPTLGDQPITTIKRKAIIDPLDKIEDGKLTSVDKKTGKSKQVDGGAVMAHSTLAVILKNPEFVCRSGRGLCGADRARHGADQTRRAVASCMLTDGAVARCLPRGRGTQRSIRRRCSGFYC